jgi:hypothetical protein
VKRRLLLLLLLLKLLLLFLFGVSGSTMTNTAVQADDKAHNRVRVSSAYYVSNTCFIDLCLSAHAMQVACGGCYTSALHVLLRNPTSCRNQSSLTGYQVSQDVQLQSIRWQHHCG